MPAASNNYFGTLGADASSLEYIIDQTNNRLANWSSSNEATGAGSALLGANCPASTVSAPNKWVRITLSSGSTGYFPVWV